MICGWRKHAALPPLPFCIKQNHLNVSCFGYGYWILMYREKIFMINLEKMVFRWGKMDSSYSFDT